MDKIVAKEIREQKQKEKENKWLKRRIHLGIIVKKLLNNMLKHNLLKPKLQYLNGSGSQISLNFKNKLVNRFVQI
jgi:hypothetical protein